MSGDNLISIVKPKFIESKMILGFSDKEFKSIMDSIETIVNNSLKNQ